MLIRILVVDDSSFFCQQLTQILNSDPSLKVVGIASNGREAIEKVSKIKPDIVTMDVEMPVMDGITAVKHIMSSTPVPILMLSSLTYEGAKLTLDALDAGAIDFHLKSYESLSATNTDSVKKLIEKVKTVAKSRPSSERLPSSRSVSPTKEKQPVPTTGTGQQPPPTGRLSPQTSAQPYSTPTGHPPKRVVTRPSVGSRKKYKMLLIGASTGGPVAVQKVLNHLPANFPIPILVIQHMPATFTGAFAARLNSLCKLKVAEAADGAKLQRGSALIAPGGKQIYFDVNSNQVQVRIRNADPRVNYQPCVDVTFASAAKSFSGDVLALVLTGMGADGKEGAKLLKQQGARVWAQNEETCVVYGMPMAIVNAGLADKVLGVDEFHDAIMREVTH